MISSLKDLEKLLRLCRRQGVTEIEMADVKFKLGDMPVPARRAADPAEEVDEEDPYGNFPNGILSPSQLAFYSSGGVPDEDPENTEASQ